MTDFDGLDHFDQVPTDTEAESKVSSLRYDEDEDVHQTKLDIVDDHHLTLGSQDTHRSQTEIKHKALMFGVIPCLCTMAIYSLAESESAPYKIMSAAVAIHSGAFLMYWLYLLGTSSQLHNIHIITAPIQPCYGHMIFPTEIKHYPTRPVRSISAMLALRGTSIHIFGAFMGMAVSCIFAAAVFLNWLDLHRHARITNAEMNVFHLEQALTISTVFALPITVYFEVNPRTPWHCVMHYLGVSCIVLAVWPYAIQSQWSLSSISIIVVSYGAFLIWIALKIYYPSDLSAETQAQVSEADVRERVHRISLRLLLSQTVGVVAAGVAMCCYLWNIEEVPRIGCAN